MFVTAKKLCGQRQKEREDIKRSEARSKAESRVLAGRGKGSPQEQRASSGWGRVRLSNNYEVESQGKRTMNDKDIGP